MGSRSPLTALRKLFRRTALPGAGRRGSRGRSARHDLGGEELEPRLLLALSTTNTRKPSDGGSVRLHGNGWLHVNATDRNDDISLHNHWPYVYVQVSNDRGLQYAGHWHASQIQGIQVDAGRGGDLIDARNCFVPTKVFGSFGSDLMYAGANFDLFYGGAQEDLFIANDATWPQMAGVAHDGFDGGDDADGAIQSKSSHVAVSNTESRFGGNLPWRPTGWDWQRSEYGKWELPLIDVSNRGHPLSLLVQTDLEIKAELRADGLRLSAYVDSRAFAALVGQWGGGTPFDRSIAVSATADGAGNLTWRYTVPANAPLPFGDFIDAAGLLGVASVDDTITYLVKWEDGPGNLTVGLEFDIDAGTRQNDLGIGFKGGVDVHAQVQLAIGNNKRHFSWQSLLQDVKIHAGYWAKETLTGARIGASGTLTRDYVEVHYHNVAKFRIPFGSRAWKSSMGGAGLAADPTPSFTVNSEPERAVFVVDTLDDTLDPSVTSLRRALDQAANVDRPVDIVFSDALATGVAGAVNTIHVGPPYPSSELLPPQPLVVNNTWGQPITIDASAIGGIAISGQGMKVGDADGPSFDYGDPSMPGPDPAAGSTASGPVTLRGITFDSNSASGGGAIEVYAGAELTLDGCVLSRNTAAGAGGAVFVHGRRPADGVVPGAEGARVTVTGGKWWGNHAAGDGGVFYVENGATLDISGDVQAHDNSAGGSGGVIYSAAAGEPLYDPAGIGGGMLVVNSGRFWNNSAGGDGGAIWAREARLAAPDLGLAGDEEETSLSFLSNAAGGSGGGIAIVADRGRTWSVIEGADIRLNTAGADGGGIAVRGAALAESIGGLPVSVAVRSTLVGNRARATDGDAGDGGGLFVGLGAMVEAGGALIAANTVGAAPGSAGSTGPAGHGGGVFVADGGAVIFGANAEIADNSAVDGGGVHFAAGSSGTFTGEWIHGNSAAGSGGGLFAAPGATLQFLGGSTDPTATRIEGNSAIAGGAIFLAAQETAAIALAGLVVTDNTATTGGGIHVGGGADLLPVALSDSTLSGNSAAADGGGIWLGAGASASMTTVTLVTNSAAGDGGGIFAAGGNDLTLTGTALVGNVAGGDGGGLRLGAGMLTATGGSFSGNTATAGAGGGIAAEGGTTVSLTDVVLEGGSAGTAGGGLHAAAATVSITGGLVSGNTAGSGGGLWLVGGTATLSGATVSGNEATVGGGIGATDAATLALASVGVSANVAVEGGGVALLEGSEAVVTGGFWRKNAARQRGGGGLVSGAASLSADGLVADGNGLVFNDMALAEDPATVLLLLDMMGVVLDANFTLAEAIAAGLPAPTGARVAAVVAGGAAARTGLRAGDVIVAYDGQAISSLPHLIEVLARKAAAAQTSATITVVRGGQQKNLLALSPTAGGGFAVDQGLLTLVRAAVVGNAAGEGAGIWAVGDGTVVTVASSTFAGNAAPGAGAGAWLGAGVTATFSGATVAWNAAGGTGGGVAVDAAAALGLSGTIVARNIAAGAAADIAGAVAAGSSHNLVATGASGGGIAHGVNGNLVGSAVAPIEALLAAFGSYGGDVPSVPLLPGSPAIDAGTGSLADQRGVQPVGTRDIGAFESHGFRLLAMGPGQPAAQTAVAGDAFATPLAVRVEAVAPHEPVAGGRVAFETAGGDATVLVAPFATIDDDLPPIAVPEEGEVPVPPTIDMSAIDQSEPEAAEVAVVAAAGTVAGSAAVIARLGSSMVTFPLTVTAEVPPKVMGVYVRGSAWSAAYLALTPFTTVSGAALGWRLADGAGQLADGSSVTWSNVDRIAVQFDQPVLPPAAAALELVAGGAAGDVVTIPTAVTLRAGGTVVEWILPGALNTSRQRILLDAEAIRAAAGDVLLDGEWTNGSSTFAAGSGDGQAGGHFAFDFNVLVGDVNANGVANVLDLTSLRQGFGTATPATCRLDINGNGSVNVLDLTLLRQRMGSASGTRLDSLAAPTRTAAQTAFARAFAPSPSWAAWALLATEPTRPKPLQTGRVDAALPKP